MKHYVFKIRPQFLESIEKDNKKNEYRLNDLVRRNIQIGDRITLVSNENENDTLIVNVVSKTVYSSWEEALKDNWQEDFKEKFSSYKSVIEVCSSFYDEKLVQQYGIVKIGIEPLLKQLRKINVLLDVDIIIYHDKYKNVSFEIDNVYRWLDNLKCQKMIDQTSKLELERYNNHTGNKQIKLESYIAIELPEIIDDFFLSAEKQFCADANDLKNYKTLYLVYDGIVDLLITQDQKLLEFASKLGIRKQVLSIDEYLNEVEKNFPTKIDYKMLSVKKEKFKNINLTDEFFDTLKADYPGFEKWFNSKKEEEAYIFKDKECIHGFLYVKTEYEDEPDYSNYEPKMTPKQRLKVGTFKIDESLKGFRLGERFLKIIFDNAIHICAQEIYITLFENHRTEIDALKNILMQWGFERYGYKVSSNGKKETILTKTLENYDASKSIRFNFPNLPKNERMFMLPINPEYHTNLFPDAILKSEDMSLYSENKGHLYALGKIYVSGTYKTSPKPGDLVIIYRRGERYPRKYTSVCTGIAVLEDIVHPSSLEEYLNVCKNKSVFTKEQLTNFYINKKYTTVIKLITYRTYTNPQN